MGIKLLTTAIALTLATAVAPALGQVTNAEKSKEIVKEPPSTAPATKREPAKAGPVTNAEKSKEIVKEEASSAPATKREPAKAGPVTNAEKSKEVK